MKGRGKAGLSFHKVSLNDRPLNFLLLPIGEFARVPWRPSVYQGDGTENRVNIQFKVTEEQRIILENYEETIMDQLEVHQSNLNSSVKPDADGGALNAS